MNGSLPTNRADFLAMLHDIQYLQIANTNSDDWSDQIAINNLGNDLSSQIMKYGLKLRKLLGIHFNKSSDPIIARKIGNLLMKRVKYQQPYNSLWEIYNVNKGDYPEF